MIKVFNALNNLTKWRILSLISKKPRCLTEIRNRLKLPFSTTHKYLKEMVEADILECKEVKDKRRKKIYSINNFQIRLNSEVIFKIFDNLEFQKS